MQAIKILRVTRGCYRRSIPPLLLVGIQHLQWALVIVRDPKAAAQPCSPPGTAKGAGRHINNKQICWMPPSSCTAPASLERWALSSYTEGITRDLFWQAGDPNLAQLAAVVETNIRLVVTLPKITPLLSQSRAVIPSGLQPSFHPLLESFSPTDSSVGFGFFSLFFILSPSLCIN